MSTTAGRRWYLSCRHLDALGYTGPHCSSCHNDAYGDGISPYQEMAGMEWGPYDADVCCLARTNFDWIQTPPDPDDLDGILERWEKKG